ncbi:fimbrial protein [Burkholderia lata]|uniref:fimbrial protein n=1 Tax=Burkholderia lata (strain ATCC 17760 / DSM 23089 / LMG 22485 / NCIMB 9086 / R18194 / 383) TaxID=482957 RepID=UPI00399963B0
MRKIAYLISIAAFPLLAANTARATDGTINFTGSVVASTCKINGGVNDQTVALSAISTNQLAQAGATGRRTAFKLELTGCAADKPEGETTIPAPVKKVAVEFENGANVNTATGRLKLVGTDAAKNVEIEILNDKLEPIKIGADRGSQNSQAVDIDTTTGKATLQYAAQYVATDAATAGTANSFVTYSLMYP